VAPQLLSGASVDREVGLALEEHRPAADQRREQVGAVRDRGRPERRAARRIDRAELAEREREDEPVGPQHPRVERRQRRGECDPLQLLAGGRVEADELRVLLVGRVVHDPQRIGPVGRVGHPVGGAPPADRAVARVEGDQLAAEVAAVVDQHDVGGEVALREAAIREVALRRERPRRRRVPGRRCAAAAGQRAHDSGRQPSARSHDALLRAIGARGAVRPTPAACCRARVVGEKWLLDDR
jgi:hypothetical protein